MGFRGSPFRSRLGASIRSRLGARGFLGALYLGGPFTSIGGVSANRVARWTGSAYEALGSGLPGTVNTLTAYDGKLAAASDFVFSANPLANCVTLWDGSAWSAIAASNYNSPVNALHVHGGDLYLAGQFGTLGGVSFPRFARYGGAGFATVGGGTTGGSGTCLATFDGSLFAGITNGKFISSNPLAPISGVARLSGSTWVQLGTGLVAAVGDPTVSALCVYDGDLIVAGFFLTAGGVTVNNIARWDGGSWHALSTGANGTITELTVYNGKLYAAGNFSTIGGVSAAAIAAWDGSAWSALSTGLNNQARAMTTDGVANKLAVVGEFTTAGGVTVNGTAYWDGAIWSQIGVHAAIVPRAVFSTFGTGLPF